MVKVAIEVKDRGALPLRCTYGLWCSMDARNRACPAAGLRWLPTSQWGDIRYLLDKRSLVGKCQMASGLWLIVVVEEQWKAVMVIDQ
jgi:hypothetical protein